LFCILSNLKETFIYFICIIL